MSMFTYVCCSMIVSGVVGMSAGVHLGGAGGALAPP